MLQINIGIPQPSQYVSHKKIEEISTAYSRAFREKHPFQSGRLLDVDRLADVLEISMVEEEQEEPEGSRILAVVEIDQDGCPLILVNERYRDLFEKRPEVRAAAIGHEIGHIVLRHLEILSPLTKQISLLPDDQPQGQVRLHKSDWGGYGMTKAEIEQLKERKRNIVAALLKAATTNDEARQTLKQLDSKLEPEWMFWQAECFARCLLIPSDLLREVLNKKSWNFYSWSSIYELGNLFGVSGTMMRNRLEKVGIIEIVDGRPRPGSQHQQTSLF